MCGMWGLWCGCWVLIYVLKCLVCHIHSPSFLFTYSQRHANGTSSSSSTGNTGSGVAAAKEEREEEDTQAPAPIPALSEESLTTLLLELETAISTNAAMRKQGKHAGMYVFRYRCDICAVCAVCVALTIPSPIPIPIPTPPTFMCCLSRIHGE